HPYRLDISAYRDFRPCLQLASLLFLFQPALEAGLWDEFATWLCVSVESVLRSWLSDLSTAVFLDGGYIVMRNGTRGHALLRALTARFRPAHSDSLHVDLWWKGKNLLRDGGTFTYADCAVAKILSGAAGHNVQEFDGYDQMPRVSWFLYGSW